MPGSRFLVLLLLLAGLLPSARAWTGISASLGEYDSVWRIGDETRPLTLSHYGLAVEDGTKIGLRLGLSIGEFGLRLKNPSAGLSQDYAGEFLGLYLRWPWRLGRQLALHGRFVYDWHNGRLDGDASDAEVNWSSSRLRLGLEIRMGQLGLRPFVEWQHLDGDVELDGVRRLFAANEDYSSGLVLDLEVEPSAYVRLTWTRQGRQGLLLSFVRSY